MLPEQRKYRVKLGNFVLGWIAVTELTVRYTSHLEPMGAIVTSIMEAMSHFRHHVPSEVEPHLALEPMEDTEVR